MLKNGLAALMAAAMMISSVSSVSAEEIRFPVEEIEADSADEVFSAADEEQLPDDGQDETEDQEYLEPWEECVTDFDAEEGLGFYSVEEGIGDIEGIETNEEVVETIEENFDTGEENSVYTVGYTEGDFGYTDETKKILVKYTGSGGPIDLSNTSVEIIGPYAFDGSKITSISFPNTLVGIRGIAFNNCKSLTSITWGTGLRIIRNDAFLHCEKLVIDHIPDGVIRIDDFAFRHCDAIRSLKIPASVVTIGSYIVNQKTLVDVQEGSAAWTWARSINQPIAADFTISGSKLTTYKGPGGEVVIPDCVTVIGENAFKNDAGKKVTRVEFPSTVTSIEESAFEGCSNLEHTNIDGLDIKVKTIGKKAFYGCSKLHIYELPDDVTSIGDYAFAGCSSITYLMFFTEYLTTIGTGAFDKTVKIGAYCGSAIFKWAVENQENNWELYGNHSKVTRVQGKAATDTEEGLTDGQKCEACGLVITPQETIPKITATPTFSKHTGGYTGAQELGITCTTTGAKIYYTTDGTDPTTTSTEYSGPITIDVGTTTVKAIAAKEGIRDSRIVSRVFYITAPVYGITLTAPTFSAARKGYSDLSWEPISIKNTGNIRQRVEKVELSGTNADAFTLSGYTENFEVSYGVTDTNCYIRPNTGLEPGTYTASVTATYSDGRKASASVSFIVQDVAGTPVFSKAKGVYTDSISVEITCATSGAIIYYTTDESTPDKSSAKYTGPLTIDDTATVKAIAVKDGICDSEVASIIYVISNPNKILTVDGVSFEPAVEGYAQPAAKGIAIRNTGSGSAAVTAVEVDGDDFVVSKTGEDASISGGSSDSTSYTIRPKAGLSAGTYTSTIRVTYTNNSSQVSGVKASASVSFTVLSPVAAPTFYPSGGTYPSAQNVSLSAGTGTKIYYTTDGKDPTTSSTLYSKAFKVDKTSSSDTITVKAIAVKDGMTSGVASATYIIKQIYSLSVTPPSFDTLAAGYTQPEAKAISIMNTGNSDAAISSVALSGSSAAKFKLNKTSGTTIKKMAMDQKTYTIQPVADLPAGTYTATIVVTYNNNAKATAAVTFTVQDKVESPVFEPGEGTYKGQQSITLTCGTKDAKIYYTISGQGTTKKLYTAPIKLENKTAEVTVTAYAVKSGMKNSDEVTAVYNIKEAHAVTVNGGSGSTDVAVPGEEVTLIPSPEEGYFLKDWKVESGNVSIKDNKFVMGNEDVKVRAEYEIGIFYIYVDSELSEGDGDEFGTVTGSGYYQYGETVSLLAVPEAGYKFTGWRENGKIISTDASYSFKAASDRNITGTFEPGTIPAVEWMDGDGFLLDRIEYAEGTAEPKTSLIPTKADSENKSYIFSHWDNGTMIGATKVYHPVFVEKINIEDVPVILNKTAFTYNGKRQSPTIVSVDIMGLKPGTDYAAEYPNSVKPGTYTVKIKGIGKYTGVTTAEYVINKATNTLRNVSCSYQNKHSLKVKSGAMSFRLKTKYTGGNGTVRISYTSNNAKVKVNKNGKVTLKKGLKKGTYKVTATVKAEGNANYLPGEGTAVFRIRVK